MCSPKKMLSHSKDIEWHAKYFQKKWMAAQEENEKLKKEVVVLKNEIEAWKVNAGVAENTSEESEESELLLTPPFSPRRYSRSRSRSYERHFRRRYLERPLSRYDRSVTQSEDDPSEYDFSFEHEFD